MQCVGLNQSADHEAIHLAMHLGMRKHAGIALGPWPDALARRKFQKQRREQVDRKGRACYHMYLLDVSCCTGGSESRSDYSSSAQAHVIHGED